MVYELRTKLCQLSSMSKREEKSQVSNKSLVEERVTGGLAADCQSLKLFDFH